MYECDNQWVRIRLIKLCVMFQPLDIHRYSWTEIIIQYIKCPFPYHILEHISLIWIGPHNPKNDMYYKNDRI